MRGIRRRKTKAHRASRSVQPGGRRYDGFNLDTLLHPAGAFADPMAVVSDPELTLNEKRAILSCWASDACAVDTAQAPRPTPAGKRIELDEIMDALRVLDRQAGVRLRPDPHYRRVLANRRPGTFARKGRGSASNNNKDKGRSLN